MWNDKRYHSLDYELKQRYGEKVYKISLDGGMTCPNRDGTLDTRGCIFCSRGGSGDFAEPFRQNIKEQIDLGIRTINRTKAAGNRYIAYFQAFTNTYAPVDYLRQLFMQAITHPAVAGLSIATRPDCLDIEVLKLLGELNRMKPVWVELGLQTIHEDTAAFIRRGYTLPVFKEAVLNLHRMNMECIVHVILGLPGEDAEDVLQTIRYISALPVSGIKLQLLHILKDTDLAGLLGTFHVMEMDEYINLLILCLEHLPPDMVIHRITGDGPKKLLLAPLWSSNKKNVMNQIHHELAVRNTWQGRLYQAPVQNQ